LAASSPTVAAEAGAQPSWLRRILFAIAAIAATLYVIVVTFVYFQQEKLIFHASSLPPDYQFTVPGVEELKIPVNGAELSALQFRLPNPKGVVFFLHGNGGNLQSWLTSTEFYRRVNYDLFMIDYRGYGKSSGMITSEEQLHADVRAVFDRVAAQYAGKKIVIYGRSLGTGLAAKLASEIQPDLTVLVSPYVSLAAMGEKQYPWLPQWINRYPMHSDQWLPSVKTPVLITHGDLDSLIPLAQAETLASLRTATKLVVIKGAGHNDVHKFAQYLDTLADSLQKL
jgi:hypothetical protein